MSSSFLLFSFLLFSQLLASRVFPHSHCPDLAVQRIACAALKHSCRSVDCCWAAGQAEFACSSSILRSSTWSLCDVWAHSFACSTLSILCSRLLASWVDCIKSYFILVMEWSWVIMSDHENFQQLSADAAHCAHSAPAPITDSVEATVKRGVATTPSSTAPFLSLYRIYSMKCIKLSFAWFAHSRSPTDCILLRIELLLSICCTKCQLGL